MRYSALIAAASVTLASSTVLAAPGADELAKQARVDAVAGRYQKAIDGYKRAFAIAPEAKYQCNIGVAYYRLAAWPRAHFALAQCIAATASLSASVVAKVSQAYAYVEKTLKAGDYAPIRFRTTPDDARLSASFLASDETFGGGRTVWAPFGTHSIQVRAKGYQDKGFSVSVTSRDVIDQTIVLTAVPKPAPIKTPPIAPVTSPGGAPAAGGRSVPIAPSVPIGPSGAIGTGDRAVRPSMRPAWISFGVAVVALAGGVVFHVRALSTRDSFPEAGAPDYDKKYDAKSSTLRNERYGALGLYGVSAVAAGVGTYLWLRAFKKSPLRVGPMMSSSHAGVWARWSM